MRKKILSLGLTIWAALTLSAGSAFALSPSQASDAAIKLTRAAGDYGRITIPIAINRYETVRFTGYERDFLEVDFSKAVLDSYQRSSSGDLIHLSGFLEVLQEYDKQRVAKAGSGMVQARERAKAVFRDKLYVSFLQVRGDPNYRTTTTTQTTSVVTPNPETTVVTTVTTTQAVPRPPQTEYTFVLNYTTISGKVYAIWSTRDGKYRFRKGMQHGFTSLSQVQNFLERQNRILYMAPNGRMYGIFLSDGQFYFNRDEGSISTLSRNNLADIKAYINQHNQPIAGCQRVNAWKCR